MTQSRIIAGQIVTAEPWTAASVLAGLALVALIVALVMRRVRRGGD